MRWTSIRRGQSTFLEGSTFSTPTLVMWRKTAFSLSHKAYLQSQLFNFATPTLSLPLGMYALRDWNEPLYCGFLQACTLGKACLSLLTRNHTRLDLRRNILPLSFFSLLNIPPNFFLKWRGAIKAWPSLIKMLCSNAEILQIIFILCVCV